MCADDGALLHRPPPHVQRPAQRLKLPPLKPVLPARLPKRLHRRVCSVWSRCHLGPLIWDVSYGLADGGRGICTCCRICTCRRRAACWSRAQGKLLLHDVAPVPHTAIQHRININAQARAAAEEAARQATQVMHFICMPIPLSSH